MYRLCFEGIAEELQPGFDAGAGIEIIAQGVADKVERQHGKHYGERGKQHEMRSVK